MLSPVTRHRKPAPIAAVFRFRRCRQRPWSSQRPWPILHNANRKAQIWHASGTNQSPQL